MDAELDEISLETLGQMAAVAGLDLSEERQEAILPDVRTMLAHGRRLGEMSLEEVLPATTFRPDGEV